MKELGRRVVFLGLFLVLICMGNRSISICAKESTKTTVKETNAEKEETQESTQSTENIENTQESTQSTKKNIENTQESISVETSLTDSTEETISINKESLTLKTGESKKLKIIGTDQKIEWTSSDENVAIVNENGKVFARDSGTVTIFAKVGTKKVSCEVVVEPKKIRVVLKTTGYGSIFHSKVSITSNSKYVLVSGTEKKNYKAKKNITITSSSSYFNKNKEIYIQSAKNGKIKINSIQRLQGGPAYRGTICIRKVSGKGLVVINELPIEEYLYAVVSSEMPTSFNLEALKAQAVTARSYTYSHLNSEEYKTYDADLDDSSNYQVYNNSKETKRTIKAVDETKSEVLKDGKAVISTYYFSTSFGQTTIPSKVWKSTIADKYYKSIFQVEGGKQKDLSNFQSFQKFIQDKEKITYDNKSAWYRWNVTMSKKNLQKTINGKIATCYGSYPSYVLTLQNGAYVSKKVSSIGNLKKVEVIKREKSGMVAAIKITGGKATVQVASVQAIRMLLAPVYDTVIKMDKSTSSGLTMLPSGFFYIEDESGANGSFTVCGGGFGHGIGLSQYGANEMARQGYGYDVILEHYFQHLQLKHIYQE